MFFFYCNFYEKEELDYVRIAPGEKVSRPEGQFVVASLYGIHGGKNGLTHARYGILLIGAAPRFPEALHSRSCAVYLS